MTFALLLAAFPAPVHAQAADDHLGGWYAWKGEWAPREGTIGFKGDLQLRDFQVVGDFAQFSIRGGVVFTSRLRPLSLTVGAAWMVEGEAGEGNATRSERRTYQTVNYTQPVGSGLRFRQRARAEQRWFEGDYFRTRYRYRLEGDIPLTDRGFDPDGVWLVASNEVLVNGETESGGRNFDRLDQNRAYVALNWPLLDDSRIEVGYLNVALDDQMRHRVRVTVEMAF